MAKVRRAGFGTVFQVENETVGIGTTANSNTVQVSGNVKSSNTNVIGIATLPTYKGFLDKQTRLSNNEVDLDNLVGYVDGQPYYGDFHVHNRSDGTVVNMVGSAHTTLSHQVINDSANFKVDTLSGDIIIDGEFTVSSGTTYCTSVDQLTVTSGFSVPTGTTDDRIHCHTAGSMRFNEDLKTLEFYTGDEWRRVNSFKDTGNRGRGVFGGGWGAPGNPTNTAHMNYIQIATLGNSLSFGELTQARRNPGGRVSSSTRGIISGGFNDNPTHVDTQDYCTIASEGDFIDFGNLLSATYAIASGGVSSSTRGVLGGGNTHTARTNVLQYVQISTIGNAVDFGDLTQSKGNTQAVNSPTRGLFCGGENPGVTGVAIAEIDSISIASLGNATDFGDMRTVRYYGAGVSNGVRGVVAGGVIAYPGMPGYDSSIEFVTIATDGNSIPFGELTTKRSRVASTETLVRGVFIGSVPDGPTASAYTNVMDFINIASAGNAQDFGDMTNNGNFQVAGFSDSHGGLGGF